MENKDKDKGKDAFDVIVNGVSETWPHKKINYAQAINLAFPEGPTGGNIRYSVTWTKPDGTEGSMRPGSGNEDVVDGMIFDVRNTDKS